ncbi:MAG: hypothetical protein RLP44_03660 [Aggregatilineales bacterium]
MSLLSRNPNTATQPPALNNQAQNTNTQNQANATPSRFNRPNNQQNNTNNPFAAQPKPANNSAPPKPTQNNNKATSSRFSGKPNRFGASDVTWIISPTDEYFVRFDLNGLGDPFHRLLGVALNLDYSDVSNVVIALEDGGKQVTQLQEKMEAAWKTYKFNGAGLVYPWKDEIKQIIATQSMVQVNTNNANANDDDYDASDTSTNAQTDNLTTSGCLRSIDLLLVLNVLARTRADLLLAESPITFERGFLERSLVTNEPRIVALARATGCVEEHFNR